MSAIKILIVEDEELIAEDIFNKLTKEGYEVIASVNSCEKAIEAAKNNMPDLAFLDVEIEGNKDGIETAKELQKLGEFPVIFLTQFADKETIKRAAEVGPANYLNKPFTEQQLHVSINIALINAANEKNTFIDNNNKQKEAPEALSIQNKLFLKDDKGIFRKYHIDEILFIEAGRAYCYIYTSKGKLMQSINMKAMEEKINHPKLMRVHRSYVVNIDVIDGIKGNLLIINDDEIPVSEQYREEVFKNLQLVK